MNSLDWKKLGNYLTIDGHQLFVIDTKKMQSTLAMHHEEYRKDFPVMVFLHGYPTSTLDYYKVFPELSEHYRLVMHDHLGFGFSDKPKDVSYSLMDQADRALEL